MGMRQFQCKKCDLQYEELATYDETGKYAKIKCPGCKSKSKSLLISGFTFKFSGKAAKDTKWYNASHDRRYWMKREEDRKNREDAENRSHMGSNPYPELDDISGGQHFGEVQ